MGQESFDAFMRAWYEEHMFKEVTTAEFRAAIEKASDSADVKALLDRQNDINKSTICSLSGVFALETRFVKGCFC